MSINKSPTIAHLLPPDKKFVPHIVNVFNSTTSTNRFFVFGSSEDFANFPAVVPSLEFVTIRDFKHAEGFLNNIGALNAVITYSLDMYRSRILSTVPDNIPVAWMLFGHEYYSLFPKSRTNSLFAETRRIDSSLVSIRKRIQNRLDDQIIARKAIDVLLDVVSQVGRQRTTVRTSILQAMQRAQLLGFPSREECTLLKSKLPVSGIHKWFSCVSLGNVERPACHKTDMPSILLGNSATSTNNHIEIINFLACHRHKFSKLFVPLSYGSKKYASIIERKGHEKLGMQFQPLIDFFPPQKYAEKLSECRIAIMNHRRQQGLGTTLLLIQQGVKVFLSQDSTVLQYLKRLGLCVYSIEEDLLYSDIDEAFSPLTKQDFNTNRQIVWKEFCKDAVVRKTQLFVNALLS